MKITTLRKIRRFQKIIKFFIFKTSFIKLMKKIIKNVNSNIKHIQKSIFEILQKNIETFIIEIFENKSNALFLRIIFKINCYEMIFQNIFHVKRIIFFKKNIHFVRRIL